MSEKAKNCFIIMPFGNYFDEYYRNIYIPAIKDSWIHPKRVDDIYKSSNIVGDIWNCTKSADIILADLTGKNPNVFYELWLAHAIAKPAILIAESMDDIPFDLRSLRVITYNKNIPDWWIVLQKKITEYILETLKDPEETILPTFIETSSIKRLNISPNEKEILELRNDINSLKREIRTSWESIYDYNKWTNRNLNWTFSAHKFNRITSWINDYSLPTSRVDIMSIPTSPIWLNQWELWNDWWEVRVR